MNALCWLCANTYIGDHSASIEVAKYLIEKGIDINAKDSEGWNALHRLCFHWYNIQGKFKVIEKRKFYIDDLCHGGKYGVELANMLIENGIDVNAKTNDCGHNALHLILFAWHDTFDALEMAALLETLVIEKVIDLNTTCDWEDTALKNIFQNYRRGSKTQIAKLLVQRGMDVNAKSKDGRDVLYYLTNDVSYIFGEKTEEHAELEKIIKDKDTFTH